MKLQPSTRIQGPFIADYQHTTWSTPPTTERLGKATPLPLQEVEGRSFAKSATTTWPLLPSSTERGRDTLSSAAQDKDKGITCCYTLTALP